MTLAIGLAKLAELSPGIVDPKRQHRPIPQNLSHFRVLEVGPATDHLLRLGELTEGSEGSEGSESPQPRKMDHDSKSVSIT
jgi:hypothetical protein